MKQWLQSTVQEQISSLLTGRRILLVGFAR